MASRGVPGPQLLAATLSAALLQPAPAMAADLAGQCCAELEERIAELEATAVRKGNRKVKLEVSGFINEGLLYWDDGLDSNIYQGTNDVQRSRFRFRGEAKIAEDIKAGYHLEIGVRANRLSRTDEESDDGDSELDLRYSAWFVDHKALGRVWLGYTSYATDAITELNTANLTHFARHSASKWNMSNTLIVDGARTNGATTTRRWRDLLPADGASGDNVPGEGDRGHLIRYESPKWQGFQVQAAWGEDDFWDVALRYAGEIGGFKVLGGVGYGQFTDANLGRVSVRGVDVEGRESLRGCAHPGRTAGNLSNSDSDNDCETIGGSLSVMHEATGLFATAAAGVKHDNLRDELFGNRAVPLTPIQDKDWFWGIMGGLERKFVDLGKTTLYGEYALFEAGAQIDDEVGGVRTFNDPAFPNVGPGANYATGSEVWYWGFGLNQHIEKAAMDLYIGYRRHEGELTLSTTGNPGLKQKNDVQALDLILAGAKIQF